MKLFLLTFLSVICIIFTAKSQIINNNFQVTQNSATDYTVKLQLNVQQNSALLGNSVIRFSYDTSSFSFSQNPQENTDYTFYNLNNSNYSYSVSHPSSNIISINVALISGTAASISTNLFDLVSIHFKKIKQSDNADIKPVLQQFFSPASSTLWSLGNWQYSPVPLILSDATILDSVTVELSFSEQLDINSAQNISNYAINNGISVESAALSSNLNKVVLKTSIQVPNKNYTVTVQNVKDVNGNPILSGNNTFQYNYFVDMSPLNVTSVTVNNKNTETVRFSKRLDAVSANDINNYKFSNNLQISRATLLPDSQSVSLKTSNLQNNVSYSLTLSNIKDRSGKVMSPNPVVETLILPSNGKGNKKQNPLLTATSSSWVQDYSPANVIDTQATSTDTSRWLSATPMPDTLSLDMGKSYPLNSMNISFYKWNTGRLYEYSIFASNDSVNWSPLVENIWSDSAQWTNVDFDSTNARFIKLVLLQSNQSQWASIWKIQIFGTEQSSNNNLTPGVPENFELSQNYPNPFNPSTKIDYSVPQRSNVQIVIYDILGNKIKELVNGTFEPGNYTAEFNASNLSSGIYFYRIQAGKFVQTKKMILLK